MLTLTASDSNTFLILASAFGCDDTEIKDSSIKIDKSKNDKTSEKICSVITGKMLEEYIEKELDGTYGFLNADDKRSIKRKTVLNIYDPYKINRQISVVRDRIRICLMEKSTFNINGFFDFRIKDILSEWSEELERQIYLFLREKETNEMLISLKTYVKNRTSLMDYIRVDENIYGRYEFINENNEKIITIFSSTSEYTKEEELINTLLFLCPAKIDISAVTDKELTVLIYHIFEGRIIQK